VSYFEISLLRFVFTVSRISLFPDELAIRIPSYCVICVICFHSKIISIVPK